MASCPVTTVGSWGMGHEMTNPSTHAESLRDRRKRFQEQEILRAAAQLVQEHGCRALTMDKLARHLGVSKGTIYRYFPSRDGLLRHAVDGSCQAVLIEAGRIADQSPPGQALRDATRFLVFRCLGLATSDENVSPFCCLREIECPYIDWDEVAQFLKAWSRDQKSSDPDSIGLATALFALTASAAHTVRGRGGQPSPEDAVAVLRYLFPT